MHALPVAGHEHHVALIPHVEMLATLADEMGEPGPDLPERLRAEHDFVVGQLMPHMAQTEAKVYPELERLMQNRHSMVPMRREHEELRGLVTELDHLCDQPLDLTTRTRLRRVLYRMHAMLRTHLAEEEAYLRVLDHNLDEAEQAALVKALEHAIVAR